MKTKLFYLSTFLLASIILSSCISKTGKVKIGLLMDDYEGERWIQEREFFTTKVNELGAEVIVRAANFDGDLQVQQARELLDEGAEVLVVIAANGASAAKIVRMAHGQKAKVIAYDRLIQNCDLDYYISHDNVKVGQLMAQTLIHRVPQGNYVLLWGSRDDPNAIFVKQGQMEVLSPLINSNKINIIYKGFIEDWSPTEAAHKIQQINRLHSGSINAILSSYDGLSTAVIKELKESGVFPLPAISGQDAEVEACQNILNDTQTMTVFKPLNTLASSAAQLAVELASGEVQQVITRNINNGRKMVPSLLLDPIALTKENIKEVLLKYNHHYQEILEQSKNVCY